MTNDTIAEMKREIEKHRQERVAQGKPANKPPRPRGIVPQQTAWALLARCKPLAQFLTAYIGLCDKSKTIADITPEQEAWLDTFEETLTLLAYADDKTAFSEMYKGQAIGWLVSMIKNRAKYEEIDEYVTKLFIILQFVTEDAHRFNFDRTIDEQHYADLLAELAERKEEFDKWVDS